MERDESGKFSVPEPPSEVKQGFLTDYWKQSSPLPQLKGRKALFYFLVRGLITLAEVPMNTIVTVTSVTCSLFIISVFLLAYQNLGRTISEAGNSLAVTFFVKEGSAPGLVQNFKHALETRNDVIFTNFVAKEQAWSRLKEGLGDRADLLDGLEAENPLPASVEVTFDRDKITQSEVAPLVKKLADDSGVVQEVLVGNEWMNRARSLLRTLKLFGLIGFFATLLVVGALIANTIRLVFHSQRELIAIMRLVGASEQFVKLPFVLGGIIQGFIGGVFSLLLLKLIVSALQSSLLDLTSMGLMVPEIEYLSVLNMCIVPMLGIVVGAFASSFSVGKYLNV